MLLSRWTATGAMPADIAWKPSRATTAASRRLPESVACHPIPAHQCDPIKMLTICATQIMEICYKCGVKVVTVYAFKNDFLKTASSPEVTANVLFMAASRDALITIKY